MWSKHFSNDRDVFEQINYNHGGVCPCDTQYATQFSSPKFIGNDYYCESENPVPNKWSDSTFFPNDPLWDGKQCSVQEAPCCKSTSMPWFTKFLNEESSSPMEIRLYAIMKNLTMKMFLLISLRSLLNELIVH